MCVCGGGHGASAGGGVCPVFYKGGRFPRVRGVLELWAANGGVGGTHLRGLFPARWGWGDHLGSSKLGSETIGHFIFSFCMTKKSNQHSTYFSATTPHFMTKHTHYNTMYICLTKRRSKNTYYFDYYLQVSTCNRNM